MVPVHCVNNAPFWSCCHGSYSTVVTNSSWDTSKAFIDCNPLHLTQLGSTSFMMYSGLHVQLSLQGNYGSDIGCTLDLGTLMGNMSAMQSCPAFNCLSNLATIMLGCSSLWIYFHDSNTAVTTKCSMDIPNSGLFTFTYASHQLKIN